MITLGFRSGSSSHKTKANIRTASLDDCYVAGEVGIAQCVCDVFAAFLAQLIGGMAGLANKLCIGKKASSGKKGPLSNMI